MVYVCLLVVTYEILKISLDLKNSKTKMCFRSFWGILILLPWMPSPPSNHHTITTENEITQELVWHKLGPDIFFNFLFILFFIFFLFFTKSVPTRTESHLHSKLFESKYLVGDAVLLAFIGFQKFQNQNVFQVILSNSRFFDNPPPNNDHWK